MAEVAVLLGGLFGPVLARIILAALLKKGGVEAEFIGSGDIAETLADSLDIASIINKVTRDPYAASKGKPFFEQIGYESAEALSKLFQKEMGALTEGEKNDVIAQAKEAINENALRLLLENRFNPSDFQKRLKKIRPKHAFASELEEQLYLRLLQESAQLVFALADKLPYFTRDTTAKLLQDHRALQKLIADVIETQERIWLSTYGQVKKEEARVFDSLYKSGLVNELNRLNLFGVDNLKWVHSPLDIGFVQLKALVLHSSSGISDDEVLIRGEAEGESLPAISLISSSNRNVVIGDAGYGKTTLLKWVAVQIASNFPDETLAPWKTHTPFFIRMRDFSKEKILPTPQLPYALESVRNLASGMMPSNYVHSILERGLGLLILDGMDEVTKAKRDEAMSRLQEILSEYPNTKVLVSMRPSVLYDKNFVKRLESHKFNFLTLQKMSGEQVEFIKYWHRSLGTKQSNYDVASILPEKESALITLIRNRNQLASLATTPLLCAMICTLHLEDGDLPDNEIELYRRCIDILLQRDTKRGVDIDSYRVKKLDSRKIERYLGRIAYYMLERDSATIHRHTAAKLLNKYDIDGELYVKYLSERTGVLQQQAQNEFDFIHRSFQEYLAAAEIIEEVAVDKVVQQAVEERWHRTILMLAAHVKESEQSEIVQHLYKMILEHNHKAQKFIDLAISFVSFLNPVTMRVRQSLLQLLTYSRLSMHEGLLKLDLRGVNLVDLSPLVKLDQLQILHLGKAHVSDLSPLAKLYQLQTLEISYVSASDLSPLQRLNQLQVLQLGGVLEVDDNVELTWDHKSDLSETQFSDASTLIKLQKLWQNRRSKELSYWSILSELNHLQSLNLSGLFGLGFHDLSPLAKLTQLQTLNLSKTGVINLSSLVKLSQLKTLDLSNTKISDLSPLAKLNQLQTLDLSNTEISDLSPLVKLSQLQTLNLSNTKIIDLSPLEDLAQLRTLALSEMQIFSDIAPPGKLGQLQTLNLTGATISNLYSLENMSQLRTLNLSRAMVADLHYLRELTQLESLNLSEMWWLSDLPSLEKLKQLRTLDLSGTKVDDLSQLGKLTQLQTLNLSNTTLIDLSQLEKLTQLQTLDLSGAHVDDLSSLEKLTQLQTLDLSGAYIGDLSPLEKLTQLQALNLSRIRISELSSSKKRRQRFSVTHVSDLSPLKNLSQLQKLDLSQANVVDLSPLKDLSQLQTLNLSYTRISDLSPLEKLSQLQTLNLNGTPSIANLEVNEIISTYQQFVNLAVLTK